MGVKVRKRRLYLGLIVSLFFLVAIVILFDPNKAFSSYTDEIVSSEERYGIDASSSFEGVPDAIVSMFSDEDLMYKDLSLYVNYKDDDGNSLKSDDIDYIEYSCGDDSICEMSQSAKYWNDMFGDYYWEFYDTTDSGEIPTTLYYGDSEYKLDHYYVTYGNLLEEDFCKPIIRRNGSLIGNKVLVDDYFYYFSEKVVPNSNLLDNFEFKWNYTETTLRITNSVVGEDADLDREFYFEIAHSHDLPDGMYGDVSYSGGYGGITLKSGESANYVIPGNAYVYIASYDNDAYFMNYTFSEDISITYKDIYSVEFVVKGSTNSEINFEFEEVPAQPLVIRNDVYYSNDDDKEFGFTVSLSDETINGEYGGVEFKNGIGRFHLKNGESKVILLPTADISYEVYGSEYIGYNFDCYEPFGVISDIEPSYVYCYYEYDTSYDEEDDGIYTATVVGPEELLPGRSYVVFRATGGVAYMLTGKGNAKPALFYETVPGGKIIWPDSGEEYANVLWRYSGSLDNALFESFGDVNSYLTVGKSTSGKRPVGTELSYVKLNTTSYPAMNVSNDNYYLGLTSDNEKYTSSTSKSSLYFAEIDEKVYNVIFDGSNGGLHVYPGTVEKNYSVIANDEMKALTEESVGTSEKYNYEIKSWVDIETGYEVLPGESFEVTKNSRFYANWVAADYNVGKDVNVAGNLDTSSFVTTEVFDYNELFNLYSSSYNDGRFSLVNNGDYTTFNKNMSKGIVFLDNFKNSKEGMLNSIDGRNTLNASRQVNNGKDYYDGITTSGISSLVLNDLFNKNNSLVGVNYVGSGNYLYQYDDKTGFYYYDSSKNAASYNQSKNRFYVYDYTYGTSKSHNEGENKTDFLPFNYMSKEDAQNGKNFGSGNGATNYWFGLKSSIDFSLIDDPGYIDSNGNYGNKDIFGNDMILKFSGDDDVWVYIDDKLVLDLGGIHDIVYGEINFSTGILTIAQNGAVKNYDSVAGFGFSEADISDPTKIIQMRLSDIGKGDHRLDFYYVERGASRANYALYFNICNNYDEPGDLIISRDLASYAASEKHEFTLSLSDTTINGTYGDLIFANGVTKFKLIGGEQFRVSGLPAGLSFTISVDAPKEHSTQFTTNGLIEQARIVSGRIVGGNVSKVNYLNDYSEFSTDSDDILSPDTGDNIWIFALALGGSLVVIVIVLICLMVIKKKKKRSNSETI